MLPPGSLPSKLCRFIAAFISFVFFVTAHAAELPAVTAGLKVEITSPLPIAWTNVGWSASENDIYILYSGNLYEASGAATSFDIGLTFSERDKYDLIQINKITIAESAESHTENKVSLSAASETVFTYTLSHGKEQKVSGKVIFVPVDLVPDWNRDGRITYEDRGKATKDMPWRFWRNSDDDSGTEDGDDIQQAKKPDYWGNKVDGVRDLVDFFPVHFDLKVVLKTLPETKYQYSIKHKTQTFTLGGKIQAPSFNVIWYPEARLTTDPSERHGAGSYLKNDVSAKNIAGRKSITIHKNGLVIPDDMLKAAKADSGVALFESRFATNNPIILEIKKKGGVTIAEVELPLKIMEVEDMFRLKYLKEDLAGGTQGGVPKEPENWADADRNGKHFIFVHGYNVSGKQARGWNSEVFKRMFWSGSNAMFTGIAWYGNESQVLSKGTPDFWRNVHNAFRTSKSVARFVNALPGGDEKYVAAHSLGNILVSSAIQDHGLKVSEFFMVDAAAAIEAFSSTSTLGRNKMSHPDWRKYDKRLWCSEWYKLFPEGDNRRRMTWRGRFSNLSNVYNFYSRGEEVLKNGTGEVPGTIGVIAKSGLRGWVKGEMSKGYSIGTGGGLAHNGTGGWDWNHFWDIRPYYPGAGQPRRRNPAETASIKSSELRENPFFERFKNKKFFDPKKGSAEATKYNEISKALAESLPALTFAAGSNPVDKFDSPIPGGEVRNFDMMNMKNGWIKNRKVPDQVDKEDWLHSDIRNVAYVYTYKVYEKFVELGKLDK